MRVIVTSPPIMRAVSAPTIAADENFIDFEISEGMAATMVGADTALIIGGDVTITRIQILTF